MAGQKAYEKPKRTPPTIKYTRVHDDVYIIKFIVESTPMAFEHAWRVPSQPWKKNTYINQLFPSSSVEHNFLQGCVRKEDILADFFYIM